MHWRTSIPAGYDAFTAAAAPLCLPLAASGRSTMRPRAPLGQAGGGLAAGPTEIYIIICMYRYLYHVKLDMYIIVTFRFL